jgi:serine/threonine protein kinase
MSAEVTTPSGMVSGAPATALSSNALPMGTRIHEFEITQVIGEGGFSVVYLAFDHTLHRSIALKEYIPSALASRRGDATVAVRSAQHQQTFEAGLRSFINEARLLAQFDHPALVKVYRFWEANGTAYMAMPYYGGRTLKQILRENPAQASEAWLKRLLVPLLDALELLHGHRCYHRDIAPDNIQVLESDSPVLLDFGAARRTIGDMTQAFTVILKPGYAPIEQYADEADLKQGPWTDVYALSAVLYGAVVGKPPPTAVARVIKDPLERLTTRALPGYSQGFLAGIDRGLGVRPEERPQSIADWRESLGVQRAPGHATEQRARGSAMIEAATQKPASLPAAASATARTETVERVAASGDSQSNAETERTVLVPGLRRGSADARPDAAVTHAREAAAAVRDDARHRRAVSRPWALIGIAVVIAATIAAVAVALFRTPPPAIVAQVSTPAAPGPSAEPQAGPIHSLPARAEPDTAPPANPSPSDVTPAPANASPSEAAPPAAEATVAPSPPAPRTPSISDDDRQWARIRNSGEIADFLAFQLQFPMSSHSSTAAARIKALERAPPERARPKIATSPGPAPAKTAGDKTATSLASSASAAPSQQALRPPAAVASAPAGDGAKVLVRIHVRPFGYVYIDGTLVGPSPPVQQVPLAPGRHRIEARNPAAQPPVVARDLDVAGTAAQDVQLRFDE